MKSKRSQIGTTLTWVAALFVILFIMAIFIAGSLALAKLKGVSMSGTLVGNVLGEKAQFSYSETAIINGKLIDFVNTKLDNGQTIYELLSNAGTNDGLEKERQTLFNQKAKEFLSNFPEADFSSSFSLQTAVVQSTTTYLHDQLQRLPTKWSDSNEDYFALNGERNPPSTSFTIPWSTWTIPIYPDKQLTFNLYRINPGAEIKL